MAMDIGLGTTAALITVVAIITDHEVMRLSASRYIASLIRGPVIEQGNHAQRVNETHMKMIKCAALAVMALGLFLTAGCISVHHHHSPHHAKGAVCHPHGR
jgi:hypothetical protein